MCGFVVSDIFVLLMALNITQSFFLNLGSIRFKAMSDVASALRKWCIFKKIQATTDQRKPI